MVSATDEGAASRDPRGGDGRSLLYAAASRDSDPVDIFLRGIALIATPVGVTVFEVDHPGDYATFNSNQSRDGTATGNWRANLFAVGEEIKKKLVERGG
jgi:hypothetical protein